MFLFQPLFQRWAERRGGTEVEKAEKGSVGNGEERRKRRKVRNVVRVSVRLCEREDEDDGRRRVSRESGQSEKGKGG